MTAINSYVTHTREHELNFPRLFISIGACDAVAVVPVEWRNASALPSLALAIYLCELVFWFVVCVFNKANVQRSARRLSRRCFHAALACQSVGVCVCVWACGLWTAACHVICEIAKRTQKAAVNIAQSVCFMAPCTGADVPVLIKFQ